MKVYSYANPFSIDKAVEYWDEIKKLPQLCISQTLVQGMLACYGRTSFTVISTIQSFLNEFYKDWEDSPENDIAQYVELSDQINSIQNENIKRSMKFNKKETAEALRYCMELGLEPEKFQVLNEEQKEFINIYKNIKNNDVWNKLDTSILPDKKVELNNSLINLIVKEINKEIEKKDKETTQEERKKDLQKKIQELKAKTNKQKSSPLLQNNYNKSINNKISKYSYLVELNEQNNLIKENKIVLHGVHQFTPIIWRMVKHLEELGVEVIFLINYDRNFKKIYNTWEKIYFHLTGKFNFEKYAINDSSPHKDLGRRMGDLLEGKRIIRADHGVKFNAFDNLTSFSDYVSKVYEHAKKDKGESNTLSHMSKQFYAVSSQEVNDILKAQYPEQYGEKHFLAYPVGAFILSLYNMWNADSNQLEIDETNLKECLSVGFFNTNVNTTAISVYDRISLYFKNAITLDDYINRIKDLKNNKISLEKTIDLNESFSKMSFYSVTLEELEYFEGILNDLKDISRKVFNTNADNKINYKIHFSRLMEIIKQKCKEGSKYIDEAQLELVNEIANKLKPTSGLESVNGLVEDLKEAIHFYLSRRKDNENDSANWIVRDFEQIDGGVLLSKDTKDKTYHYALLSDKNMKGKEKQVYKWPLNDDMINGYDENHSGIDLVVTAKKEYKNFLRYSLFYGIYFLNRKIELSYIVNSEGEKDIPYFILSMLGLKPDGKETEIDYDAGDVQQFEDDIIDNTISISALDKKLYSICSGKYLYNSIMNNKFYYKNEFHCRYYYIILLRMLTWKDTVGKSYEEACRILDSKNNEFKKYLPFWNEVDFIDIAQKAKDDLKQDVEFNKIKIYGSSSQNYLDNKVNFLMASIKEDGFNIMKFDKCNERDVRVFLSKNFADKSNSTDERICEYCNQRDVCLNKFLEGDNYA
jgi:hypothetical protein